MQIQLFLQDNIVIFDISMNYDSLIAVTVEIIFCRNILCFYGSIWKTREIIFKYSYSSRRHLFSSVFRG